MTSKHSLERRLSAVEEGIRDRERAAASATPLVVPQNAIPDDEDMVNDGDRIGHRDGIPLVVPEDRNGE